TAGADFFQNSDEPMRAGDGLYTCWFTICDLPYGQSIKVFGKVVDIPRYLTGALNRWSPATTTTRIRAHSNWQSRGDFDVAAAKRCDRYGDGLPADPDVALIDVPSQ